MIELIYRHRTSRVSRIKPLPLDNDQTIDSQADDKSDSGHPNEENQ